MNAYKAGDNVFVINVTDKNISPEEMKKIAEAQIKEVLYAQGHNAGKENPNHSMSYDEFVRELQNIAATRFRYEPDMVRFLQKGYTSEKPEERENIRDINRTYENRDDTTLLTDILLLKRKLTSSMIIEQRVSTRRMYEKYQKEGLEKAISYMPDYQKPADGSKVDLQKTRLRATGTYTDIRDQLIVRPKNYEENSAALETAVYKTVGEIALILYQLIGNENGQLYTSQINRDELKQWGMEGQGEKVLQEALENTAKLYPPCVYNWTSGQAENFLTSTFTRKDIMTMNLGILLSTFQTTNGATALFYPGVREKMLQIMGGPFCAVFMNVNDVMIIDRKNEMLKSWLITAGKTSVLGTPLSDKCYLCDQNGISVIDV